MSDKLEIADFIHDNSFAILVTGNSGKMTATHLPVLLKENEGDNGVLYAHIAKANRQWKDADEDVLVIFPGAHKYITPTWYESDQTVPTWSYLTVHVYGKLKLIEDRDGKVRVLEDAVKFFEGKESSYDMFKIKPANLEGLVRGIVAFRIDITEIQGKKKVSQHHPEERQQRVIAQLEKSGDEDSMVIASKMKENLRKKSEQ